MEDVFSTRYTDDAIFEILTFIYTDSINYDMPIKVIISSLISVGLNGFQVALFLLKQAVVNHLTRFEMLLVSHLISYLNLNDLSEIYSVSVSYKVFFALFLCGVADHCAVRDLIPGMHSLRE